MMVETILESSQDFGSSMSSVASAGTLPQWKRELLQRRAARSRAPAAPVPAPTLQADPAAPAQADDDEELRYGPGIVKRLKSRYLSLALREAPRRRASLLRRAASLEHLLDERPPPAPRPDAARQPRPVSLAAPPTAPAARRDYVKRARSVDALSRLDAREELAAPPPSPPLPPPSIAPVPAPPPPLAPRPPVPRSARPPRRPPPLLRDAERPPPDVVRSTLRKFETAPTRRASPAARVSAVLRGLEPRTSTPEPRGRSPSPEPDLSAVDEPEGGALSADAKQVSRAALDGIARAGSTVRYSFDVSRPGDHLPPVAAANPVLLTRARLSASPRRVGVIRPMPAPALDRPNSSPTSLPDDIFEKVADISPKPTSPAPAEPEPSLPRLEKKDTPPSAVIEPIPRYPSYPIALDEPVPVHNEILTSRVLTDTCHEPTLEPETLKSVSDKLDKAGEVPRAEPLMNGHTDPERGLKPKSKVMSRIGGAGIERAWSGAGDGGVRGSPADAWGPRRARGAPPPPATSVVFNFSSRKEVPDYIENDGLILRAARRTKIKAGESGVVVLRPGGDATSSDEDEGDGEGDDGEGEVGAGPCPVRFLNDNIVINGRSSMPARALRDHRRIAKLKLQFDDSLTRTHEYPSEASFCEDEPQSHHTLLNNAHLVSESLSRYTPSKTVSSAFQLGVTRREGQGEPETSGEVGGRADAGEDAEADASAEAARSWSEARAATTDLLF